MQKERDAQHAALRDDGEGMHIIQAKGQNGAAQQGKQNPTKCDRQIEAILSGEMLFIIMDSIRDVKIRKDERVELKWNIEI